MRIFVSWRRRRIWVRSESLSVTQHNASGSLLFNKYLLIPCPISQRSLSTKKACLCQPLSICVCGSALYFRTFARKEPYHKAGNWLCLYNTLFPGYSIQVKLESNKPPCTCSFSFQVSHLALFIAFTATSGQGHWTLAWEKNATFSRLISYRTSNRSM